jgi:ribosomal-protein-alanine N-acetyltransferase
VTPAIRRATAADLDAIDEIERHSFPLPWPRGVFASELARSWARIDVACDGRGDVIAFHDWWLVAGELHVLAIATHPDHRRRGIAALLLASAIGEGKAGGAATATLEVRRGNAVAIVLYERFGFRTVHVRARYYDDGEDALVMTAELAGA